jgi:hypothetical protein
VSTARAIKNDTAPPPGAMGMLLPSDPMAPDVVKTPDWSKIEAYTQDSLVLGALIERAPQRMLFDTCVFTHLDTDHILPALHTRALDCLRFHTATYNAAAASCRNLMLLLPESNLTTNVGVLSLVGYNNFAHLNVDPLSLYHDLLTRVADPLEGYEQYQTTNWDGEGAEPITAGTLAYARRVVSVLPTSLGAPDIAPAADGSIALEWVPDDPQHKLDRLFLDIGPGEQWRAYWTLRTGEFGRIPQAGFSDETKTILDNLFRDLSA